MRAGYPAQGICERVSQSSSVLRLFLAHRAELLNYASRLTGDRARAEDVLQDAWLRFRTMQADRALDEPAGYLRRIVRNLALDGRRREALESRLFRDGAESEADAIPSDTPTPEAAAISEQELRIVSDALAAMPERVRVAVEMHRIDGAKLKDIAAHLCVSVATAHQLVADGVERLRLELRRQP
jgi:RNA polymerase sigma factor (sigma-70 family)